MHLIIIGEQFNHDLLIFVYVCGIDTYAVKYEPMLIHMRERHNVSDSTPLSLCP